MSVRADRCRPTRGAGSIPDRVASTASVLTPSWWFAVGPLGGLAAEAAFVAYPLFAGFMAWLAAPDELDRRRVDIVYFTVRVACHLALARYVLHLIGV